MIPTHLRGLVLGRRRYWIYVAVLLILKIALVVAITVAPKSFDVLKHVDTWLMLGLAFVVGARFADLRWPRWLGITLVVMLTFVIPIAIVFLSASKSTPPRENPLDYVPDLAWVSSLGLFALLVIAGLKSGPDPLPSSDSSVAPTPGT